MSKRGKSGDQGGPDDPDAGDGSRDDDGPPRARSGSSQARRRLGDRVAGRKREAEDGEKPEREPPAKLNRPKRQPDGGRQAGDRERGASTGRKVKAGKGAGAEQPKAKAKAAKDERDEKAEAGDERRRSADAARRDRDSSRRRRARPARHRVKAAGSGFVAALWRAGSAAGRRVASTVPKLGHGLLAALAFVFRLFFAALGAVLGVAIAAGRVLARPVGAVLGRLDRAARAASRAITPARALAVVVAGAAILLALSQYADYRSISIGNDAYSGMQTVAPAPETGRLQAGDPHSYVFVPIAIACLPLLAAAMIGGRWRLLRLVTLAGAAAVLVALIVDRPAGLDAGTAAISFEGVQARLIGGFYAQTAAGILLIGSSSLLARELRLGAARSSPAEEPKPARSAIRTRRSGAADSARA